MKKFMLLVSLLAVMSFSYSTNVVPVGDAVKVSKNFLSERLGSMEAQNLLLTLTFTEYDQEGTPLYYRFQVGERGFILVSATDLAFPVLAYSMESNFVTGTGADIICSQYKATLSNLVKKAVGTKSSNKAWNHYLSDNFQIQSPKGAPAVEPLVTTTWNQSPFYNADCPYNPEAPVRDDRLTPVGCVALTMGNILYYYRYPEKGYGIVSYVPKEYDDNGALLYTYAPQTVNYSQATYNYDAIPNSLNNYGGELAKLLYHCGVSVRMSYGSDGSGSQSEYALTSLQDHYFFNSQAQFQEISDVVIHDSLMYLWENKMISELDAHRPLFYSGNNQEHGGHAWIVDGYTTIQDTHYFHVNWGWAGDDNGFYLMNYMNSNMGPFNVKGSQSLMLNLYPSDTNAIAKPATSERRVTASKGTISDGAGNMKYAPNSHRSWVIACPDATAYKFQFSKLKLASGDKVIIYNGGTEASGVKKEYTGERLMAACSDYTTIYVNDSTIEHSTHGDFSGTALDPAITVNADSVLVVFTSDATNENYGFVLDFEVTSFNKATCSNITMHTNEYSGTLSDKPGNQLGNDDTYRAATTCQHRLNNLQFNTGYDFFFTKFDLKAGDFVDFYNPNTTELLARYDINHMPNGVFRLNNKDIMVRFVSDNWLQGTGFELEFAGALGIDQHSDFENVNLYPNPATENLNVTLSAEAQDVLATVVDLTGKVVYNENFSHNGGEQNYVIPVNGMAKGIYFLNLQGNSGKTTHKFIVK